jgi:hypothetical protein
MISASGTFETFRRAPMGYLLLLSGESYLDQIAVRMSITQLRRSN